MSQDIGLWIVLQQLLVLMCYNPVVLIMIGLTIARCRIPSKGHLLRSWSIIFFYLGKDLIVLCMLSHFNIYSWSRVFSSARMVSLYHFYHDIRTKIAPFFRFLYNRRWGADKFLNVMWALTCTRALEPYSILEHMLSIKKELVIAWE